MKYIKNICIKNIIRPTLPLSERERDGVVYVMYTPSTPHNGG